MLVNRALARRFRESRALRIFDRRALGNMSGIQATVFGATGFIGRDVTHHLGAIGTEIVCPSRERFQHSDTVKLLRVAGPVGYIYVAHHTNFNDPKAISRLVEKSNTVVNCLGPRKKYIRPERFREVNIELAERVARQARKAGVKRLIHLSSVGVAPDSPSLDLATKWEGEQRVREQFPEATILRLTQVIGPDDYFSRFFRIQTGWFDSFIPVFSDLSAKRQPILVHDVSASVLTALKQPETMGKVYELGGPHVYTIRELYDLMANSLNKPLTYGKMNREVALALGQFLSWDYFNAEEVRKQSIDLTVSNEPGTKTIADLGYRPVSVVPTLESDMGFYRQKSRLTKDDFQL